MGKKQTELDNYGLYYANQLDKLIGKRVGELAPTYRRLQKSATEHLKELYAEIEKTTDARVVSKRYRAKLQQMIIERIMPELQILDIAQQAYVTEVLAGTLQYGYYTTAHSLEQVLGVAVNVSLLNRSGVLGVIANPWLPDNHTYSDRIRANTQLVANKAKDVVENIITKGLRYDEAAKQLSANIGESYNNATRIVRTEMTRANALGTTYGMLENADLYEGKYWDATIDGNTAHRCAVNDKKVFDLDYDTSENPGIPGQRIPNHPHCRCMWKPKIEGLDPVKVKSYKTKDGREDFIKADNYDDYAKQLGLPSAKEMLESDNPRRYLRPGETLEDINKQVIRKEFNGHTITASRAPWDSPGGAKAVDKVVENSKMKVVKEFTPAKTTKEATAWGRNNLGIDYVDYTGFHVDVANDVNKTLLQLRNRFPQITDTKIVSTSQTLCTLKYEDDVVKYIENAVKMGYEEEYAKKMALSRYGVKKKKVPGNAYAWSTNSSWGTLEGITFNKKYASNFDEFVKCISYDVKSGFHPVGTDTPAAVLTHEFGHQIDNFLKKNNARDWVQPMFEEMQLEARPLIRDQKKSAEQAYGQLLSQYGANNSSEFFAEAFSEYMHNPNPRPIALKFGKKLEETLRGL